MRDGCVRVREVISALFLKTVCGWLGNSPTVAAKHYAVSVDLDGDFRRACGMPEIGAAEAQRNAQQSAIHSNGQQGTGEIGDRGEPLEIRGCDTGRQEQALAGIILTSALLPSMGIEPIRPCDQRILSP